MKKRGKGRLIALGIGMALALVGCGGGGGRTTQPAAATVGPDAIAPTPIGAQVTVTAPVLAPPATPAP